MSTDRLAGHGQPLLSVAGLSVTFAGSDTPAVDDASWSLRRGRITALVGESGSGKSVSAAAILGLLPDSATVRGSIRHAGPPQVELVGASASTYRSVRGAVFSLVSQEPMSAWNPVLRIGDQVAEAVSAHRRIGRRVVRARVLDLLAGAGLADAARIARSFPHQLSGGQLQRALIAMALAQEPAAIIADEPTTALDVTVQAGILDVLRGSREQGTAILLITHDMGVVADLADDVVVMAGGRVVERADVTDLFAAPAHPLTRVLLDAVPHLGAAPAHGASERRGAVSSVVNTEVRDASVMANTPRTGADTSAVRLEELHVRYRMRGQSDVQAVAGVDLKIDRGEILGLVGESGSGKSTVGRVVAGLLTPTAGRAVVADVDLAAADRRARTELRRRTGIVFQDPASTLDPRWTVGRSVAEPLRLHTHATRAQVDARVADLLDQVRLDRSFAQRYPHELSGGQRQRVAIARAVALGPAVLVADEPTSALDVSVQAQVLGVLRDLREELSFACLFISHDLAVVERVADRVAVMQAGLLVEQGPTADVLAAPRDPYTRGLVAAAPVADPARQAERRREGAEMRGELLSP